MHFNVCTWRPICYAILANVHVVPRLSSVEFTEWSLYCNVYTYSGFGLPFTLPLCVLSQLVCYAHVQLLSLQVVSVSLQGRPQRGRSEGQGSTPSSFVPLQPTGVGSRGVRDRGGGDMLPSPASSSSRDPWSQASEMLHAMKLVDKNMHWEDKGSEVRVHQLSYVHLCTSIA